MTSQECEFQTIKEFFPKTKCRPALSGVSGLVLYADLVGVPPFRACLYTSFFYVRSRYVNYV